jgi:hypothetical protein
VTQVSVADEVIALPAGPNFGRRGRGAYQQAFASPAERRTLLFKMFNKISTWQLIEEALGETAWETYNVAASDEMLSTAFGQRRRLYSAAYVMPPPAALEKSTM